MYPFQLPFWAGFRANIEAIFRAKKILLNCHPEEWEQGIQIYAGAGAALPPPLTVPPKSSAKLFPRDEIDDDSNAGGGGGGDDPLGEKTDREIIHECRARRLTGIFHMQKSAENPATV